MSGFAGGRVLILIVELFIKSSIILAAAMLGAGLLRRRSASLRHFLLSICLVGLAVLPALSVFSPGWQAPWFPSWAAVTSSSRSGLPETAVLTGRTGLDLGGGPALGRGAVDLQPDGPVALPRPKGVLVFRTVLATFLPALWLAGFVLILGRFLAGLSGIRRITREGEVLDDPAWKRLLERFISTVRLTRPVEIKAHPQVIVPLTWGFRHPVVIMPDGTSDWTEETRSSAFFHELSHVKRADFLVMLPVRLSLAVFWFNPLFWVAYRMLKNEQEMACDELVLKAGIRPSTYADNLLSFVRSVRLTRSPLAVFPGVLGMFGRSQLRDRLLAILGQKMAFKEVPMKAKVMVTVLVLLALAFIGLAHPRGATATPGPGPVAPDSSALSIALAAQAVQAQDVQKAPEKQKKEEPKPGEPKAKQEPVKKNIRILKRAAERGQGPIEITVIGAGAEKTIQLAGSVTIKKGEDGKTVVLGPGGKEIAVIEGEGAQLKIKGGGVAVFEDDEDLESDERPEVFRVIEDDKEFGTVLDGDKKVSTVIVKTRPHLEIVSELEEPEHITIKHVNKGDREIVVKKRQVTAEPHVSVEVEQEELQEKLAETQALLKKIEAQKLAESSLAAQQESLKELEHSLQVLEEELNKAEQNLKTLKVVAEPEVYVTVPDAKSSELKIEEYRSSEETPVHRFAKTHGDEAYSVALTMKDNSKETYDKAVAKLKQGLPQGYELESKFDEASGTMTFRITAKNGIEEGRGKVETLIKELQSGRKNSPSCPVLSYRAGDPALACRRAVRAFAAAQYRLS